MAYSMRLMFIFALVVVVKSQESYYDEDADWIQKMALRKIAENLERDLELVDTLSLMGEARPGPVMTYDLELLARDGDRMKICEAKLLVDASRNSYDLRYYDCEDREHFEERDDIPMNEEEEVDDSDYVDCDEDEKSAVTNEVLELLNRQVDETNEELDYPGMVGMDDLKQQYYELPRIESCKKATRGRKTVFKCKMSAQQDGITQKCDIELDEEGENYSLPKSQCQGQN